MMNIYTYNKDDGGESDHDINQADIPHDNEHADIPLNNGYLNN
jgi:hypothetical protein